MAANWTMIDTLVHELGAVRAVADEVDADPRLADDSVARELRTSLARAADTVHLVIGGDEAMVSQARRCLAEAQEIGRRARGALERAGAVRRDAHAVRQDARARTQEARDHIADLNDLREANEARCSSKKSPPRDSA